MFKPKPDKVTENPDQYRFVCVLRDPTKEDGRFEVFNMT